jgi:hypothetical protein
MSFRDIFDETRRKIGGAIGNQVDNFRVGLNLKQPRNIPLSVSQDLLMGQSARRVLGREGLGSAAGIREAEKGVLRAGVEAARAINQFNPSRLYAPKAYERNSQILKGVENRLAPRGNEVQKSLNTGFNFGARMAPYGPIEGAAIGAATKVLPRLASSKAGQFAIRRGADVLSGQMLATPEEIQGMGGGLKGRAKIAAMDIVGGTAMEGAGKVARPVVKAGGQKINLAKNVSKMGKELPSRVKVGENAFSYNRGGRTLEVPNEVAEFYIKNGKMPTKNDILPKNYKYKGTTELRFQDGKFHGWDSDNDLFKAKIAQEAPSIGLSTKDISGKSDALSNEARKTKIQTFDPFGLEKPAENNKIRFRDILSQDKLKNETGDQYMARKVGYQIDNGVVKIEQDPISQSWKSTISGMGDNDRSVITGSKNDVIKQTYQRLNPEVDFGAKYDANGINLDRVPSPQSTPSALSNEVRKTRATFDDNIPQNKLKNQLAEDTKSIIDGAEVKERSFGKRVKLSENTPKEVKELVGGSYVVKSNKKLTADAKNLIRTNIDVADQMAMNPRNANDIEVGNQLIVHYQNQGNFQKAADIANAMNKSLTEGGQFVQAASLYDKTTPGGIQRFAQAEVEKFNKANPNKKIKIDDKTMESLFKRAEKIQKMAEGRDRSIAVGELFNEVADIIPTSNWKKAIILWKAGLLTSFRTHERNLVGNTLNVGGEIAKDPIAAVMDALMSTRTGSRTKTFTLSGMGKGTVKGASSAKDYLYKGFDPEKTIEKFDVKRINWGKSKLGKVAQAYTEGVFRALGAGDKPFYHSALTRSLYDQAGAKAINAGKRGNKQFIENLVTNPTDDMLKIATRDAEIAVFQQSTTAGNMLSSLKKKLKDKGEFAEAAGEFFLPFTQVPSGVGSQLVSYSPAGLTQGVLNTARTMITKDAGLQRQAAEQMGRGIVGTGIMALGYELYRSGNMTGKYPADAKEREQWKLEGKQENSVKIGGKWRKLSAIGPQASILVTGAQLAESVEEGDASALSVASSAGSEFLDQPFVQGMSVPLDVLKDPERNVKKFSNQASASLIPNIVKDVSRGLDPYKREAETAGESIRKSIPLMRNDLPPMRDAYGEPLPEEGGVIKNMFDLFNSLTPKGDDTTKELRRLLDAGEGATPSRLQNSQTIAGEKLKLKNAELDEIEKIAGPMTKQGFDQMIKTPEYQEMSDGDKRKALQKIVEDARAVAKLQAAESKNLVDVDTLIEKSKKLTKDQKELLSGGTFASVKRDYDLDKQIDLLDGSYGKLAFLKKKKDFATWQTEAEGLMKMYEEKYTNAETEADKMKYELKIIKLAEEMQKYAGYGGFTKGKSGGSGSKFTGITLPTTTAKIPIRQAKAPAFKNISKTPRIAIKTNKPKIISKSTLANLR